jgi:hypothetical protein
VQTQEKMPTKRKKKCQLGAASKKMNHPPRNPPIPWQHRKQCCVPDPAHQVQATILDILHAVASSSFLCGGKMGACQHPPCPRLHQWPSQYVHAAGRIPGSYLSEFLPLGWLLPLLIQSVDTRSTCKGDTVYRNRGTPPRTPNAPRAINLEAQPIHQAYQVSITTTHSITDTCCSRNQEGTQRAGPAQKSAAEGLTRPAVCAHRPFLLSPLVLLPPAAGGATRRGSAACSGATP